MSTGKFWSKTVFLIFVIIIYIYICKFFDRQKICKSQQIGIKVLLFVFTFLYFRSLLNTKVCLNKHKLHKMLLLSLKEIGQKHSGPYHLVSESVNSSKISESKNGKSKKA